MAGRRPTTPRRWPADSPPGRYGRSPTPPAAGCSGYSRAGSRSAACRPTDWSAPISSAPRTTTACRTPRRRDCSRWSACPTLLLGTYYFLRGVSLLMLPQLFAPHVEPSMWLFILFYGLDWIATVPPTVALCREFFGPSGPVVFGWVFASHQLGAAVAAVGAGWIRDHFGAYQLAWYLA